MAVEPLRQIPYAPSPQMRPEPPRFAVLDALRRHLPIALLPVILLVAAAVGVAYVREPVYTSEARLNVGGLNLTQASIEGYTSAVQHLAIAYARSIDATGVVTPPARELRLEPSEVVDRVSATPIQGSSVIRVLATGSDPDGAKRLADATADSLVSYAITLNSGKLASGRLLTRFRAASRDFQRALAALRRTPATSPRRRALQTRVDVARLKRDSQAFVFSQSQVGQAATELVQKLAPAAKATSNRGELLRDLVAGAVLAGILIGIGLAVARANALARRRLGEP